MHNTTESYIDYLKSLGCVFYVPLTQDNNDIIKDIQPSQSIGDVSIHSDSGLYLNGNSSLMYDASAFSWMGYSQSFTVLCDFNITALPSDYYKFFIWGIGTSPVEKSLSYARSGNTLYCSICDGRWNNVLGSACTLNTQYNKMGLVYDSTNHRFSIIQNGVISGSQGVNNNLQNNQSLYIGSNYLRASFVRGNIRNFMVFDRALTQELINGL